MFPSAASCTAVIGLTCLAPVVGIGLPDFSVIPGVEIVTSDVEEQGVPLSECRMQESGWPTKLDWGIYWFGPNNEAKKAKPRPQTEQFDPRTWFRGTEGQNMTEQWEETFYDPSRNTVIYIHGWSDSGTWSTRACKRVSTACRQAVCPSDEARTLAEPWLEKGWNVGFFYWDQFADEPCMRDAEQKIWFDRDGDGLKWLSYTPENRSAQMKPYTGPEVTVADMCVSAVKEAMGDFYSGSTVRFIGRSIGAQLAVACAAKLHYLQHVAAPQRLTLLDPFFTSNDFQVFGTSVRCGEITTDDSIDDYAREATANFVKMLWIKKKVVTEMYASSRPEESSDGMQATALQKMQKYALRVVLKPDWCEGINGGENDQKICKHMAVLPIYFLSFADLPPLLAPVGLEAPTERLSNDTCEVPAASCEDSHLRGLVEAQVAQVQASEEALQPPIKWEWQQSEGVDTFTVEDDKYTFSGFLPGTLSLATITPSPSIEDEIQMDSVISQREWGMSRRWHLGPSSGMSLSQLHVGLFCLFSIACIPVLIVFGFRANRFIQERLMDGSDDEDLEEDDDEETVSSWASERDSMMHKGS